MNIRISPKNAFLISFFTGLLIVIAGACYGQPNYIKLKSIEPSVSSGSFVITSGSPAILTYTPTIPLSKITGISATSPLFYNAGTFSIQPASASQSGALSLTDWNTFNNKQSALTFNNGLTAVTNTVTNDLITGVNGGQTITGGTGVGDILSVKGTSANGTSAVGSIAFKVGNNGSITAGAFYNTGNLRIAQKQLIGNIGVEPVVPLQILTQTNGDFDASLMIQNTSTGGLITDGTLMGLANGLDFYFNNKETAGRVIFKVNGLDRMAMAADGSVGIGGSNTNASTMAGSLFAIRTAVTTGAVTPYTFNSVGNSGQTASTVIPGFKYTAGNRGWATGTIAALQPEVYFSAPTYSAVAASTFSTVTGLQVDAPIAGTNVTFTNKYGITTNGNIGVTTAGSGLVVKGGTNSRIGTATLVAGTVTVANTSVTANTRIFVTVQSLGTVSVMQAVGVTARVNGTSFTITSANVTDTSVISWFLIEEN